MGVEIDLLAIGACCGTMVLRCIGGCIMDAVKETDFFKSTKKKFRNLCCGCIYPPVPEESEEGVLPSTAPTKDVDIQDNTTQALIESQPRGCKVFMSPVYISRDGDVRPVYPTEQLLKKIRQNSTSSSESFMSAVEELESTEEEYVDLK